MNKWFWNLNNEKLNIGLNGPFKPAVQLSTQNVRGAFGHDGHGADHGGTKAYGAGVEPPPRNVALREDRLGCAAANSCRSCLSQLRPVGTGHRRRSTANLCCRPPTP